MTTEEQKDALDLIKRLVEALNDVARAEGVMFGGEEAYDAAVKFLREHGISVATV